MRPTTKNDTLRIVMQETPRDNYNPRLPTEKTPPGRRSRSKTVVKSCAAAGTDRKVKGGRGMILEIKGRYGCTCHEQLALSMSTI